MSATTQDLQTFEDRLTAGKHQLAEKASQDAAFHDALVQNPKASIEKLFGLPGGTLKNLSVEIFEEKPGTIGIVIPPRPQDAGTELSEEQLEAVAGGAVFTLGIAAGLVGAAAGGASAGMRASGW